jgi:pyruvate, water dikinase
VDLEFTLNFLDADRYKINLLQCRHLQVRRVGTVAMMPEAIEDADVILRSRGPVVGKSCLHRIDWFVYVVPSVYGEMPDSDRYQVARIIGEITRHRSLSPGTIMLLGPGRWGTSTPSLGIPVSYAEISRVAILCEIVAMRKDFVPDVSLGTHFFHELVEMDMLYVALFPGHGDNFIRSDFFESAPNQLAALLPDGADWVHAIRVLDVRGGDANSSVVRLAANAIERNVICYRDLAPSPGVAPEEIRSPDSADQRADD